MNRIDFMAQLKRLLSDIPESDRNDAVAYYNDYFDEAGVENEAQVIRELGNPGKVAAMIRASLRNNESKGEYTETGYHDASTEANRQPPASRYAGRQGRRGGSKTILMIILLIFASPILLGVGGGAVGIIVGLIAGLVGIIVGLLGAAIAGLVAGIAGIITGFIEVFANPATGLLMMGSGLVSLALTLALMCFLVWLAFKVVPRVIRAIVNLCSRVLRRGRRTRLAPEFGTGVNTDVDAGGDSQ